MVKKRLLYLVLFYIACLSLVSSKAAAYEVVDEFEIVYGDVEVAPAEEEPVVEDPVPVEELELVATPMIEEENQGQAEGGEEESGKKNRRKRKRNRPVEIELTCQQALVAEHHSCLHNVSAGYDPKTCKFEILNKDCEWECSCLEIQTEPTTRPPRATRPPIESSESVEEEKPKPNNVDCKIDRPLNFKNQFIDIKGFIKRYTFCP